MDGQQYSTEISSEAENGRESDEYIERKEKGPPNPLILPGTGSFPAFYGKHRLQASLTHLNHQINNMQEELEKLETIGESSKICKDVISSVESISDPLLPLTRGSVDASWDRWFGGAHNSRNHNRWM